MGRQEMNMKGIVRKARKQLRAGGFRLSRWGDWRKKNTDGSIYATMDCTLPFGAIVHVPKAELIYKTIPFSMVDYYGPFRGFGIQEMLKAVKTEWRGGIEPV